MQPLLKRIACNGLLTAIVLAVIGFGMAELATVWMAAPSHRVMPVESASVPTTTDTLKSTMQSRFPVMMALWGFLFVAVGEIVLYLVRSKKKVTADAGNSTVVKADIGEELLNELLSQIESAQEKPAASSPVAAQDMPTAPTVGTTSSPSASTAENIPTPERAPGEQAA